MSAPISHLLKSITRTRVGALKPTSSKVPQYKVSPKPKSLLSSKGEFARQISAKTAKFAYQNPRYIALYRPSHTPWVQYELTSQPETAKECHERVLAAYEQGDYETARMQFHRYRSLGVLPLTETWHKILLIAYKEGNYHDIESLFATLMAAGVTIDIDSWNFLLDIVSKRGLVQKTEQIFWTVFGYFGVLPEFSYRALFNVCMREKRFMKTMLAYALMTRHGFDIEPAELQALKQWCVEQVSKIPGGMTGLKVPEVDLPLVEQAWELDKIVLDTSNLVRISSQFSNEGKKAFEEWYKTRSTNATPDEAFNFMHAVADAQLVNQLSESFGCNMADVNIIFNWTETGLIELQPSCIALMEPHMKDGAYFVTEFTQDSKSRSIILMKQSDTTFQGVITDEIGNLLEEEESKKVHQSILAAHPLNFIRSKTL